MSLFLEGLGRCEERALPCPTNAPGPSGAEAQGGQAAEWTGNPKGGGARLRGGRGAPRFLQPRHNGRRASAPCGFPPFGGFEFGGGIRKGGFPKGGKLMGGTGIPGPPAALFCEDPPEGCPINRRSARIVWRIWPHISCRRSLKGVRNGRTATRGSGAGQPSPPWARAPTAGQDGGRRGSGGQPAVIGR